MMFLLFLWWGGEKTKKGAVGAVETFTVYALLFSAISSHHFSVEKNSKTTLKTQIFFFHFPFHPSLSLSLGSDSATCFRVWIM
ncbi:hypothetical protein MRB53_018175 [Persea americana]|uniref:Uncharacterized protein n=1 Tax=Persea americana TaxID=3435 RepID=A0ACC2M830_PERAE|nr:hypothetical protein MRB53_018175 [Persea americana]